MERRELERQIVEKEWLMFQQVQGVNGRAACQDDWTTFLIMRLSQFEGWDTDVLESYFEDIVQAEAQERNLIMEKYAYMMEETDPVYFLSIKELLPEISEEKQLMAEKITSIYSVVFSFIIDIVSYIFIIMYFFCLYFSYSIINFSYIISRIFIII